MQRIVQPELLDSLPADDPSAMRSRRDLRRINGMMGNLRWLDRSLRESGLPRDAEIVEVGSGDGEFAQSMADDGYSVTAVDLAPRPEGLRENVRWIQGDLFEELPRLSADVLIANLFWHHFDDEQLAKLAPTIERFPLVLASEPLRAHFPKLLGAVMVPFINHVTRNDLFISIRAGFRSGELLKHWQLDSEQWQVEESTGLLGAYRLNARHRGRES